MGVLLANFILNDDFVLLNNSSHTYKNYIIDLTFAKGCHECIQKWEVNESIFVRTDHHMIRFKYDVPKIERRSVAKWNVNKANWEDYTQNMGTKMIELLQAAADMDHHQLYNNLRKCMLEAAETTIPQINANGKHKSWWDEELTEKHQEVKKKKNSFRKRSDGARLQQYREVKQEFQVLFQEKRRVFMSKLLDQMNGNQSEMWKVIRNYNNHRIRPAIQPIRDKSGEIKHKDEDIAVIFQQKYGDKPVKLPEDKKEEISFRAAAVLEHTCNEESPMINQDFSFMETKQAISKIRDHVGYNSHENIHALMMKKTDESFVDVVNLLANKCLRGGKFPEESKKDQKVLIRKHNAEDPNDDGAYRPITLESLISKCIVIMVLRRLDWKMETTNKLSITQEAYRKGREPNDLTVRVVQSIQESWNENKTVILFVSDFKGFFESVWRPLLIL